MAYVGSLLTVFVPMLMLAEGLTGLLTPILLLFLCFCFSACSGLIIANAMICSMRAAGRNSGAGTSLLGQCKCCLVKSREAQSLRLAVPTILA